MTYRIEKIADLLQVPIERRKACMRDVLYLLAAHDLAFGEDAAKSFIGLDWIDDDDHSISLCYPGGEVVLLLKITKDAP
jgi:hypothetical protein